jgi:Spy/CpxP family protein refolding chaperone
MKRWKQILGVALLIVLGALAGSIATKTYLMRWFHVMGSSPQARADFLTKRMARELTLTQDQKDKIHGIVRQVEEGIQIKKRQDTERMVDEIKGELDNDQVKKLEAFRKAYQKRRKELEDNYLRK